MSEIVTLAILAGQIIKAPITAGTISVLDITVIIFTLLGLIKIRTSFKKPPLFIKAALIFATICTVSLILSPLPMLQREYINSFLYTVRFIFYVLFAYVILSNAFISFQSNIINTLIYSGVGLAILGLLQFLVFPDLSTLSKFGWDPHYFRNVSTFLDPNFAGAYFVLTLLLFFNYPLPKLFSFLKKLANKKIVFIIVFLALLTTFSRSSYLMFLVGGLSFAILKKSKNLAGLTIFLFIFLLIGFNIYTQLISKPRNISREQSASFRLNTWQQGAYLFQSYPILGVGFNSYKFALKEYELGDQQFLNSHGATSNDSSLLFVAATTGLIGFLSYLIFLISLIRNGVKNNFVLASSIFGLLVHSIFANSLFFPPILLWILLISSTPKK